MSTIGFRGQLLVTIHKGHGYYAGVPWVGNARRRPAVRIRLGHGELQTKRWEGAGEANWHETFRFVVHSDGADPVTFLTTLLFDEQEVPVSMFTVELATLLSHVGPQWQQFRTPSDDDPLLHASAANAIRSEVLIECRWFPEGTSLPPNFLRSLSASADTSRPTAPSPSHAAPPHPSASVAPSPASIASSTNSQRISVTGAQSLSVPGPHQSPSSSPVPVSPQSGASPRHGRSGSLPASSSNPNLVSLSGGEQALRSLFTQHNPNFNVEHLTLFGTTTPTHASSVNAQSLSSAAWVYSANLHGRLHPDSAAFDDRNFLEHLAPISSVLELLVWGDHSILALQLVFSVAGTRIAGTRHGHPAVSPAVMTLVNGEYITAIGGKRDDLGVKSMTVVTNRGQRRQFGAMDAGGVEMGEDFVCQAPRGARVVCLFGGCNAKGINALGICWQKMDGSGAATLAVPDATVRGPLVKQSTTRHI